MHLRSTRRVAAILLVAMLLAAALAPGALASVSAKVNTSSAKVYKSASSKSASMRVPKNLKLSITAVRGSWARVKYKGATAYMPMKNLAPTDRAKGYASGSVTVYNSSGKKMGTLSKGTGVYVLGTVNGGYCVMSGSGKIGYVKPGTLSKTKPPVSNPKKVTVKLTKQQKAVALGKSLVGRKYSMSDNPPKSFNCSSFVQYCLGKAGYSIKGTAAAQAADGRYKKITGTSSLKMGDMLFFDTTGDGKVDHSALYVGGGAFIEASRNAGKVQTNSMTSWYKKHFKWARRPA